MPSAELKDHKARTTCKHPPGFLSPCLLTLKKSAACRSATPLQRIQADKGASGSAVSKLIEASAGYEEQKQEIEDTLLLALQHPEVYEAIAAGTRCRPGSNRPRAVLFEGPPGCGKTTSARSAI